MSTNPQKNHAASAIDAAALMNLSHPVASSSAPSLIAPLVAMPPPLPPMLAAASMASPQKREPQEEDIINGAFDGNGRSPRRPVINRPVDHPYTDFAAVSDAELRKLDRDNSILNSPTLSHEKRQLMSILKLMPSKVGGVAHNFPAKLHAVVSNPELAEIITWMPHGRCFVVLNRDALVRDVLPNYFNQTKFVSFVRQLNLWGFKRLTRGVDGKAYYHELFLKGRPYIALRIKRHKVKAHGFKPIPNPSAEPNFFNFPQVGGSDDDNSQTSEGSVRSKKQIVMSRAAVSASTRPTQGMSAMGDALLNAAVGEKNLNRVGGESDRLFLASAIAKPNVQPQASLAAAGLGVSMDFEQAALNSVASREDPLNLEMLQRYRQALLSGAPPSFSSFSGLTAAENQLAASAVMRFRNAESGLSQFAAAQPSADDILAQRLVRLQREQAEIQMLRRAHDMYGNLSAGNALTSGGLFSNSNARPSTSVTEAFREAKHFEELATIARNRARILALAGAADPTYEDSSGQRNKQGI